MGSSKKKPENASPASISGFNILPVLYSKDATHYMYAKAHSSSGAAKKGGKEILNTVLANGRTLFLVNVPPDATERELVLFFKHAGTVERVVFDQREAEEKEREEALESGSDSEEDDDDNEVEDGMDVDDDSAQKKSRKKKGAKKKDTKPALVPLPPLEQAPRTLKCTGRTAYVVFLDESSLAVALSSSSTSKPRPWPSDTAPRGLAHYSLLHSARRPALDDVRAHAESAILAWDWEEEAKKQKSKYKKGEAIVDEDGFTLVVRGGAYGKTLGGGVAVATRQFERTGETKSGGGRSKKREKKEKESFYAFQKHEKKRQELIELKKKWNEDLAKIEKLKQSRRFRPY